jgi:hypothetical protein
VKTQPTVDKCSRVAVVGALSLATLFARSGRVTATEKPDPKICTQITVIGKLNKSTTAARFASGDDSQKKFLAALTSAVTGLIPANEALGKLVPKAQRPGVAYAVKRMKSLQADLKKATSKNVLDVYSKWSTADVANFDISPAKLGYLDLVSTSAALCDAYPEVFLI